MSATPNRETAPARLALMVVGEEACEVQDWAAVGMAITARLRELGWRRHQLAQSSHVSQAVVRELHHTVERRRRPRALAALSIALGWHRRHLDAVLRGHALPEPDGALSATANTLQSRVDGLDERLSEIIRWLDEMKPILRR